MKKILLYSLIFYPIIAVVLASEIISLGSVGNFDSRIIFLIIIAIFTIPFIIINKYLAKQARVSFSKDGFHIAIQTLISLLFIITSFSPTQLIYWVSTIMVYIFYILYAGIVVNYKKIAETTLRELLFLPILFFIISYKILTPWVIDQELQSNTLDLKTVILAVGTMAIIKVLGYLSRSWKEWV